MKQIQQSLPFFPHFTIAYLVTNPYRPFIGVMRIKRFRKLMRVKRIICDGN